MFLGLTLCIHPVEIGVTEGIARVDLMLDGEVVAVIKRAPWVARVDFSEELEPHRLLAIAFDDQGQEVARAEQKVNASGSGSPLRLLVDAGPEPGRSIVRILWSGLTSKRPDAVEVTLDERPIDVSPDMTLSLPSIGDSEVRLLRVRAREGSVWTEAQLVLGGMIQSEAATELVAIPVRIDGRAPSIAEIEVQAGVESIRPIALDDAQAEVLVVRHPSSTEAATRFRAAAPHDISRRRVNAGRNGRDLLTGGDQIRFIWPVPQRGGGAMESLLFGSSQRFDASDLGVREILGGVSYPGDSSELRFAEAVAVAGIQAVSSLRPRAIVLVIGSRHEDASRLTPGQVRRYLEPTGVPLHVWSLVPLEDLPSQATEWGTITCIATGQEFQNAIDALRRDLDSQRVLWVEGDWFAREVNVKSPADASVRNLAEAGVSNQGSGIRGDE
jgi:hypothetical protein